MGLIKNRELALKKAKEGTLNLNMLPYELCDDKEVVMEFIKNKPRYQLCQCISKRLLDDKEIGLLLAENLTYFISFLSDRLLEDEDIARIALRKDAALFRVLKEKIRYKREFAEYVIKHNYTGLMYMSPEIKDDYNLCKTILEGDGTMFKECSDRLRGDKKLLETALKTMSESKSPWRKFQLNEIPLRYASTELRSDREIVKKFIEEIDGTTLRFAEKKLKDDKELALIALDNNMSVFKHLSKRLRSDPEIASLAVKGDGKNYIYTNKIFTSDKEMTLAAFKTGGTAQKKDYIKMYSMLKPCLSVEKSIVEAYLGKTVRCCEYDENIINTLPMIIYEKYVESGRILFVGNNVKNIPQIDRYIGPDVFFYRESIYRFDFRETYLPLVISYLTTFGNVASHNGMYAIFNDYYGIFIRKNVENGQNKYILSFEKRYAIAPFYQDLEQVIVKNLKRFHRKL